MSDRRGLRSKFFAWWYISIGVGFLLLAIHRALIGEAAWLIGLRVVIAAGFLVLGWFELRGKLRRK